MADELTFQEEEALAVQAAKDRQAAAKAAAIAKGQTSGAPQLEETELAKRNRLQREATAAAAERRPATPEEKRNGNITPSTTPQATNGNGVTVSLFRRSEEELKKLEQ